MLVGDGVEIWTCDFCDFESNRAQNPLSEGIRSFVNAGDGGALSMGAGLMTIRYSNFSLNYGGAIYAQGGA